MVFVELKNGKFWTNDLLVYFGATKDFFLGKSPYLHPYGLDSGFFKYTPPTLYFFSLFSWFTFPEIQFIHLISSFFSFIGITLLLHYYTFKNISSESSSTSRSWILWLSFLFIAIHLVREIHLGNINFQLLLLFSLGMVFFDLGKYRFAALCWTILVFFKPFFLVIAVPLVLKQLKFLLICALIAVFVFIFPLFFQNIDAYLDLWKQWTLAVIQHSDYQVNHDAVSSLVAHYTGYFDNWIPTWILLAAVMVFALLDQLQFYRLTELEWIVVFLALTPTFFKTDTQHFMCTLPMFYFLVRELIRFKNKMLWFAFGVLMAGFSFNSNDLLGNELGHWVTESGFLGLSNLGFVILFVSIRYVYHLQLKNAEK
jgi:hypothetical protein